MSSPHDQVRRTVMAHCFKQLRQMDDEAIQIPLTFLGKARLAAARAKEARAQLKARGSSQASPRNSNLLSSVENANAELSNVSVRSATSDTTMSGEEDKCPNAREKSIGLLASELRRMGDAVYGLQISVLHINDLCVLGHILKVKRATDFLNEGIADLSDEEDRIFQQQKEEMAQSVGTMNNLSSLEEDDGSSVPLGQLITVGISAANASNGCLSSSSCHDVSPVPLLTGDQAATPHSSSTILRAAAASSSALKKRRRPLSKEVMVAELEDYHRSIQPQQKRERRSALTSEIAVPTFIPTARQKQAMQQKQSAGAHTDGGAVSMAEKKMTKAEQRRLDKEAKMKEKEAVKAEKELLKKRKEEAKQLSKGRKPGKPSMDETSSVLAAVGGADAVEPSTEKKLRSEESAQSQQSVPLADSKAQEPAKQTLSRFVIPAPPSVVMKNPSVTCQAPAPPPTLLAALGLDTGSANASTTAFSISPFDFDEDEYEEIEEYEEIAEEEEEEDEEEGSPIANESELSLVNANTFKPSAVAMSSMAAQPASYDFTSFNDDQRDAADFLLKQVVLQGTLSTAKGAELLIKRSIPFIPIDPSTGVSRADISVATPQTSTSVAERFVTSVFKLFHRQEKLAFDHGVAYIY